MKNKRIISSQSGGAVGRVELGGGDVMHRDQIILEPTGETINISHQTGRAVEDLKEISEDFLSPTPNLVNWAILL